MVASFPAVICSGLIEGAGTGGARIRWNAGQVAIHQQPAGQRGRRPPHAVFAAGRQGFGFNIALKQEYLSRLTR